MAEAVPQLGITGDTAVELAYMAAALAFILGIRRLSGVRTAAAGNRIAALGMLIAIGATLGLLWRVEALWIVAGGMGVGALVGALLATRVPMTAMPEMVALLNGFGGAASLLVALSEVDHFRSHPATDTETLVFRFQAAHSLVGGPDYATAIVLSILIGGVTFAGSLVAWSKLAGKVKGNRLWGLGQKPVNALLAIAAVALAVWAAYFAGADGAMLWTSLALALFALVLGVGLVVPIGGADMPVVIALLNSYSGIAAMTTGFVLRNNLLIVAGSLVGASGIILTRIMCRAMNRSLANVLFGGLGAEAPSAAAGEAGYTKVKSTTADEIAPLLDAARLVIFVPGYGLAVAQAQHKTRELADLLQEKGCVVKYAIHPVAGRMPGHMNVLLAEADVPYEQLFELEHINSEFKNADVVLVLGANDVCNPAAVEDASSPIAGMPVLHVWEARTVVIVKRSLSAGYAGIRNGLFEMDNALMLFADAKKALEDLITALKTV